MDINYDDKYKVAIDILNTALKTGKSVSAISKGMDKHEGFFRKRKDFIIK